MVERNKKVVAVRNKRAGDKGVSTAPQGNLIDKASAQKLGLGPVSADSESDANGKPAGKQKTGDTQLNELGLAKAEELEVSILTGDDGDLYHLFEVSSRTLIIRSSEVVRRYADVIAKLCQIRIVAASPKDKEVIKSRLATAAPRQNTMVATRIGYERKTLPTYFVYGDGTVFKPPGGHKVLPLIDDNGRFKKAGKLRIYEEGVAPIIRDQSVPISLFFFAITQVIKPFVRDTRFKAENMMFELVGPTTKYKSALACTLIGSIWGKADSSDAYARSWNMSEQKIEDLFQAFNNHLLILDEATLADQNEAIRAKKILDTVHRLSSGQGRARTGEEAGSHSLSMISTSNQPIQTILPTTEDVRRALEVRLISFELKDGRESFFDTVPLGFSTIKDAMQQIFDTTRHNYGLLARRYIRKVLSAAHRNKQQLVDLIDKSMQKFIAEVGLDTENADSVSLRRVQPFALAYAAAVAAFTTGTLRKELWGDVLQSIIRAWNEYGSLAPPPDGHPSVVKFMMDRRNKFVDAREGNKPRITDSNFLKVAGIIYLGKGNMWHLAVPNHAKEKLGMSSALMKHLKQEGVLLSGKNLQMRLKLRQQRGSLIRDTYYVFAIEHIPQGMTLHKDHEAPKVLKS